MTGFSHLDPQGRAAMVDVGPKAETDRVAIAKGLVIMQPDTLTALSQGQLAKGDAFAVARVAGILGAKRTGDLIPLCHPLGLDLVQLDFEIAGPDRIEITAEVRTRGRTGVEMEAMTAVSLAALTLYDMIKSRDRGVRVDHVRLTFKDGGKSGRYEAE